MMDRCYFIYIPPAPRPFTNIYLVINMYIEVLWDQNDFYTPFTVKKIRGSPNSHTSMWGAFVYFHATPDFTYK